MSNLEDEVRNLREKNSELVQELQFWKIAAAQKEKEKLELMKDINEFRLKLNRIRSGGAAQIRKLDAELQSTSEVALSHLVQASDTITRTLELVKKYLQERQELDEASPRWSSLSGTPPDRRDRVHKVPPLLIGGQSIQPVVSLSRTILHSSSRLRSPNESNNVTERAFPLRMLQGLRSPNESNNVTERAFPMRMLQDVYIPLTRIDLEELEHHRDTADNSVHDLGIEENEEESMNESDEIDEPFETSRRLDAVIEESDEAGPSPNRLVIENPLEGPSWMLDVSSNVNVHRRGTPEPDSTTQCDLTVISDSDGDSDRGSPGAENTSPSVFTPTTRRRPPASPPPPPSHSNRVLKVVLSKMRLSGEDPGDSGDASPPKRAMKSVLSPDIPELSSPRTATFDAPSPNGSTISVIISETDRTSFHNSKSRRKISNRGRSFRSQIDRGQSDGGSSESHRSNDIQSESSISNDLQSQSESRRSNDRQSQDSTLQAVAGRSRAARAGSSRASHEPDSGGEAAGEGGEGAGEGRTRRPRKAVVYKEKPLNRKMRR